jgi:next to BRCA1 gene 1 protein
MHPECPDYDLCANCEALPISVHPLNHPMLKMKTPHTVIPTVYRFGQTTLIPCSSPAAPKADTSVGTSLSEEELRAKTPTPAATPKPQDDEALMPPVVEAHTPAPIVNSTERVNPWPTNNSTEREELIQLIADISGRHTPKLDDEPTNMSERSSLLNQLTDDNKPNAVPTGQASPWVPLSSGIDRLLSDIATPAQPIIAEEQAPSIVEDASPFQTIQDSLAHLLEELRPLIPPQTPSTVTHALSAEFVEDVTVPDGQSFPPGAEFVKCWRLLNDGGREWPESTELVFLAGDSLLAKSTVNESGELVSDVTIGKTAPGQAVDVWTGELKAPEQVQEEK